MTQAEELFFDIAQHFPALKLSKMFGSPCLKTPDGKSTAMFWKDYLVVKLSVEHLKHALKMDGTQLFEPMKGKLMKEWVQIPYSQNNNWEQFITLSTDYIMQTEKKAINKTTKTKK